MPPKPNKLSWKYVKTNVEAEADEDKNPPNSSPHASDVSSSSESDSEVDATSTSDMKKSIRHQLRKPGKSLSATN